MSDDIPTKAARALLRYALIEQDRLEMEALAFEQKYGFSLFDKPKMTEIREEALRLAQEKESPAHTRNPS